MARSGNMLAKPTTAMRLFLIGGVLISVSGVLAMSGVATGFTYMDGHIMIVQLFGISFYHGALETISGMVLILASYEVNTRDQNKIQNWSTVALIFSLTSLIGGGGFLLGFALAFVASIFGLIHRYLATSRYQSYALVRAAEQRRSPAQKAARGVLTLNGEEKRLYELAEQAGGAIFQAELVDKSGFSKVKVSRILDKMEGRGLIERRRRGMTNIVIITKER